MISTAHCGPICQHARTEEKEKDIKNEAKQQNLYFIMDFFSFFILNWLIHSLLVVFLTLTLSISKSKLKSDAELLPAFPASVTS